MKKLKNKGLYYNSKKRNCPLKNENTYKKYTKGITLIALVVTIVVLLILAGITITMVLGENGIIAQAKLAAEKTKEAEEKQQEDLNRLVGEIGNLINEETGIAVTNVTVTPTSAEIEETKTTTLTAKIEPEDATNQKLIWKAEPSDIVSINEEENGTTATITGLKGGEATITVTSQSNPSNTAQCTIKVMPVIYVMLYTDGTLTFGRDSNPIEGKEVLKNYGNIKGGVFENEASDAPWKVDNSSIRTVDFIDEVHPTSTRRWFWFCGEITEIKNIQNLDTSEVTNMSSMFNLCSKLKSIDVSGFNTSKVTDMSFMFQNCSSRVCQDWCVNFHLFFEVV